MAEPATDEQIAAWSARITESDYMGHPFNEVGPWDEWVASLTARVGADKTAVETYKQRCAHAEKQTLIWANRDMLSLAACSDKDAALEAGMGVIHSILPFLTPASGRDRAAGVYRVMDKAIQLDPRFHKMPEDAWYRVELPSGNFTTRGMRPRGHFGGHTWRNKFAFIQHLEVIGWAWDRDYRDYRDPDVKYHYDPNRVFHYYEGATVIAYESPVVDSRLPKEQRGQLRHVKGPFREIDRQDFNQFLASEMATLKKIARKR